MLELYDGLVKLWGGSLATESLTCGISSEDINFPSCSSTGTSTSFDNNIKNRTKIKN